MEQMCMIVLELKSYFEKYALHALVQCSFNRLCFCLKFLFLCIYQIMFFLRVAQSMYSFLITISTFLHVGFLESGRCGRRFAAAVAVGAGALRVGYGGQRHQQPRLRRSIGPMGCGVPLSRLQCV